MTQTYQLPKICCRCGEKQGVKMRRLYDSRVTGFSYFLIGHSINRENYFFLVPVCGDCAKKLERSDRFVMTLRVLAGIFVAFWFLYGSILSGYTIAGIFLSLAVYTICHFAFINHPISNRSLGRFTGEYYWFANNKFFRQFAELNPHLVAPYRFHPKPIVATIEDPEKSSRFSLPDTKLLILIFVVLGGFGFCGFLIYSLVMESL